MCTRPLLATLAAVVLATAAPAQADTYPSRPVTVVVPFGPGGTTDIMARLLQEELGRQLGTSVVVVNTAGAGGAIGMAQVARAAPDGYTLSMTTIGPLTIQPARRSNTGYGVDSFDAICGTYDLPMLTLVPDSSPHKTYADLVAWARANPGRLNYGSSGIGTMPHLSGLQQWKHHGLDVLHVPYKSTGDMVVPLKNGELVVFNETPPVARQHQLRALLALSDQKVPGFETAPTAAEQGLPVRGSVWGGLVAPKGLPPAVLQRLESACKAATQTPAYQTRAVTAQAPLAWRDAATFRAFIQSEFDKHRKLVVDNGLQER